MKTRTKRELQQERVGRWLVIGWALLTAVGFAHDAFSAEAVKLPSTRTLKVIYQAAKRFDVDAQALVKIAFLESSFNADARRVNSNDTVDVGMFQVNSVHWTTTCKAFDVFTLRGNALCAAKLLSIAAKHAETDSDWIGRYHSKTPARKAAYAAKVEAVQLADSK